MVIFVPFRQHKDFHKIQTRLVRELEKVSIVFVHSNEYDFDYGLYSNVTMHVLRLRTASNICFCQKFSGRHVVIIAQRTILPKTVNRSITQNGPRARSRTLTAVQDAILEGNLTVRFN